MDELLAQFTMEARRQDSEVYLPKTLFQIIASLQRHLREMVIDLSNLEPLWECSNQHNCALFALEALENTRATPSYFLVFSGK